MKVVKIMAIIFLLPVLGGCSYTGTTDKTAGGQVKTTPGKEFAITLDSNRTTGYEWQLAKPLDENIVRLVKPEYIPADTKLCGAPGKETWTFKAVSPGKTTVYFKYVRPWEKNILPAKEKVYNITVN